MPHPTELFDYDLPPRLIAQTPAARRDASRLLVVDRASRGVEHRVFAELPRFLGPGDVLLRNNAKVLPARLRARRPTGGRVECLLLEQIERPPRAELWRCLVRPGRKLPAGTAFSGPEGAFRGEIAAWEEDGVARVRLTTPTGEPIAAVANRLGEVPLPPYIERADSRRRGEDLERYQTVYADPGRQVAVAAPTAGLHFTPELLRAVADAGARTLDLTLHVGLGTFRPISSATVEGHAIHRERYEVPPEAQRELFRAAGPGGGRRIAVGTTSVRAIEDFLATHAAPESGPVSAEAAIFIHPPFRFRGIDALITNFHQPRSTLLCLVAAFLAPGSDDGIAWLRELYAEAAAREYRFLSYGDAMLIL